MNFLTRFLRSIGVATIVLLCAGGILLSFLKRDLAHTEWANVAMGLTFFEDRLQDSKTRARLTDEVDPRIVLVNIDDESLSKIGVWPIPRDAYGRLMERLHEFGAKVVAFDVLFPEKSPVCGPRNPDQDFTAGLKTFVSGGGQALLSYELDDDEGAPTPVPDELMFQAMNSRAQGAGAMALHVVNPQNYPISELLPEGVQLGHISNSEDADGVFRHYKVVGHVRDGEDSVYLPSLGLLAYQAFTGTAPALKVRADSQGELVVGKSLLEISPWGELKIRYSGDRRHFPSVSLHRVLAASPDDVAMRASLQGRMVFVGSSATGAHDLRHTPLDPKLPGVYAHMNAARMLLDGRFYRPEAESVMWSYVILVLGILLIIGCNFAGLALLDLAALAAALGLAYLAEALWLFPQGLEIRLFYCGLCFVGIYSWNTFLNFQSAAREKKQIKGTFSRYVSPAVVGEMLEHPDKLRLGGEKRDITCLFSDVRDFTSISEKLSATDLSASLNQYMSAMTDVVFDTAGTVDKYIGDAIVALWGAPLELPDHPARAVAAAVRMQEALPAINADFRVRGLPEYVVGIGLNSGNCAVGNMGSDKIFSYTALGDNMNLGARLEGLCKHYGAGIIVSEATRSRLPEGTFRTRPLDKVIVKGRHQAVLIHEVLHAAHPLSADADGQLAYLTAWERFQAQDFAETEKLLAGLLSSHPQDKPAQRLRALAARWAREGAPADFDVTEMTEK
jgi:adenylate cyclase